MLFFFSGLLGLVYEVIWHRQFSMMFGSAAAAGAVTLAAYFAGLGLGSYLFGELANRWENPLRAYGLLELTVAVGALAVAPILQSLAAKVSQTDPGTRLALKGLIAFAAIALPTIAMGGTLPILAELTTAKPETAGAKLGWLYLLNTAGAALGTLLFPFILLPQLGVTASTYLCAVGNALIGLVAIAIGRNTPRASVNGGIGRRPAVTPTALAFASGAGTFALQVLWNRAFALLHENSIFSFALIVSVFIAAVAAGAELARAALARGVQPTRGIGRFWIAGGLLTLASPFIFLKFSNGLEYLPIAAHGFSGRLLWLALFSIAVPVALLSAAMPLLFEHTARLVQVSAGRAAGLILAANIVGAIAGSLLAGFVLPKWSGLWGGIIAISVLFLVVGSLLALRSNGPRLAMAAFALLVGVLAAKTDLPRTRVDAARGERLLALTEGPYGVVAVTERNNSRRLKLNNHYVLGGTSSVGDERMQAHLPLLLHGRPGRSVFLGYGSGITAGGSAFHPGLQTLGIELVPEVVDFANRYFSPANMDFGANGSSRLIVGDAREYLRNSSGNFDVVIGDLVVPWRPGESSLYTLEHFRNTREAVATNGLVCVWVPAFQLNEPQFQIVINTFLNVFSEAWVWRGDFSPTEPALALIAFRDRFDVQRVNQRLLEMNSDPTNPQLQQPRALWMHLVGRLLANDVKSSERRLNSEDLPWLELRGRAAGGENREEFFVGRRLQRWNQQVREESRAVVQQYGDPDLVAGWSAGEPMSEFTLLLSERRDPEAKIAERKTRELLGPDAAKAVFGTE